jgi:hypothetical protein
VTARLPETEASFQAAVVDLARLRGWRIHHARPARTADGWRTAIIGDPGWPDLALARGPRLILAELKSARGKTSDDQREWLGHLITAADASAGALEVHVWRPADWPAVKAALR